MPSRSATRAASRASAAEQHDFAAAARPAATPLRMNTPITSRPASTRSSAAALLSTPPDSAASTRVLFPVSRIVVAITRAGYELAAGMLYPAAAPAEPRDRHGDPPSHEPRRFSPPGVPARLAEPADLVDPARRAGNARRARR